MTIKDLLIVAHHLPQFVKIFQQSAEDLIKLLVSIIDEISLLENCSSELERKLHEYKDLLQEMIVHSQAWITEIQDCLSYVEVQDDSTAVIGGLTSGTNANVAQFHRYIERIYALFNDVEESMDKAKTACQSAVLFCEEKCCRAKTMKNTTRVIGGTVTAGALVTGIGGGVGASIVAGLFTFGIGTAVGLGITAVAAGGIITTGAVTAGAAGVTTHLLATKFKSIEDTCRNQCSNFDDTKNQTSALNRKMLELSKKMNHVKYKMEDANNHALDQNHQMYTKNLLVQGVKECQETLRTFREELDGLSEKIQN